jgi:hypothetical protein
VSPAAKVDACFWSLSAHQWYTERPGGRSQLCFFRLGYEIKPFLGVAIGQWPTQYVARVVFSGKRGELRQRYREGQEDQRGALGLPATPA